MLDITNKLGSFFEEGEFVVVELLCGERSFGSLGNLCGFYGFG